MGLTSGNRFRPYSVPTKPPELAPDRAQSLNEFRKAPEHFNKEQLSLGRTKICTSKFSYGYPIDRLYT